MRTLAAVAAVAFLTSACAAAELHTGKGPASAALTATSNPTGAKGGSPPPVAGLPTPSVACPGASAAAMAIVGSALWDVSDPVHPRLVCRILNTTAHLFTADTFQYIRTNAQTTEVVLHSIGSGNESVVAGWPIRLLDGSGRLTGDWTADGNAAATMVLTTDDGGAAMQQVWIFTKQPAMLLYQFPQPLTDCICRFGIPPPTLAFSADGQYLVAGWPVGKGAQPLRVYRVADDVLVQTMDLGDVETLWSHQGHTLYLTGLDGSPRVWSPEAGFTPLAGASAFPYDASLSPDGSKIAYTAFPDPSNQVNLRVYTYDLASQKTTLLIDKPRAEVTFVKDGWVWYDEEAPCQDCPGQTQPTGRLFAMDLSTGVEQPVMFADAGPHELTPARFWPNS